MAAVDNRGVREQKQESVDSIERRSLALFESGMFCAESVLQTMAEAYGIKNALIPKLATGFCGGVARTSGMCGALAGGIMAMGLLSGRCKPADSKDLCYSLTHRFVETFRVQFGSTQCTDLLGCDISTPEGIETFIADELENRICTGIVSRTTGLVEEIYSRRKTIVHPLL